MVDGGYAGVVDKEVDVAGFFGDVVDDSLEV